uniref:Uncharacterized protein n=1 Tax=Arundo donax TaxID=35708 RepID=A0A0A9AKF5_ARUDO
MATAIHLRPPPPPMVQIAARAGSNSKGARCFTPLCCNCTPRMSWPASSIQWTAAAAVHQGSHGHRAVRREGITDVAIVARGGSFMLPPALEPAVSAQAASRQEAGEGDPTGAQQAEVVHDVCDVVSSSGDDMSMGQR